MLAKLKEKIFPCQKVLSSLLAEHNKAANAVSESSLRLVTVCQNLDGKLCGITAPYRGEERRKSQ